MTLDNLSLQITARDEDFRLFEENESLGEAIKPAFKPFVYGCARDAFNEAWIRGAKWGWAQANLELNERAQARMRQALAFVYADELGPVGDGVVQNGIPKQDTLDMSWFRSVIGHVSLAHLKVYGSLHSLQNKPMEQKFTNIVRYYQGAMDISWRAGWACGEQHAKDQHNMRDQERGTYEQIKQSAMSMERENLERRMDTLFEVTNEDIDLLERRLNGRTSQLRP